MRDDGSGAEERREAEAKGGEQALSADVIDLDLRGVSENMELHVLLGDRLGFPSFYGRNWDAFWDCITDPDQSMPKVLRLRGWDALHRRLPRDARLLRELLEQLPSERPELSVEWVD